MGRQKEIQRINRLISRWISEIGTNNAFGFLDINRVSEDICAQLLNKIYGYDLRNLNYEKRDYPAIDLGDEKNKIAFQITARYDRENIKGCLKKFKDKESEKYSKGIRFLILDKKKPKITKIQKNNFIGIYPHFKPSEHIITLFNLIKDIFKLYDKHPDQFREIRNFLEKEFADRVKEEEKLERQESGINDIIYPYRGLKVFREEDHKYFFGREDVVQQLIERLESEHFLAILGPSGCGKSSIVQAGLFPNFGESFERVLSTPQEEPMKELAFALHKCYPNNRELSIEEIIKRLKESDKYLNDIASKILKNTKKGKLLIVIDQFEQLFSYKCDEKERKVFIQTILNAVEAGNGTVKVIIVMRSDFLGKCSFYPDLNRYVSKHFFQVEPMSQKDLKRAIQEPAKLVGLHFENGLVEQILKDINGAPGELPLLEYALLELYELYKQRKDKQITFKAYEDIEGIGGALVKRAESKFAKLDGKQRKILRKMFVLHLIQSGEGNDYMQRRATKEELLNIGEDSQVVEDLLSQWTEARFLTITTESSLQQDFVDVAHEALIRKWPRIKTWVAEEGEPARQIGILRHNALDWERAKKVPGHLAHGVRLTRMEALIQTHKGDLTETEIEFLDASIEQREKEKREKEEARKKVERQRTIRFRITAMAGIILFLIAVMFFIQKNRSDREYIEALGNRLAAESTLVLPKDNIKAIRIAEAGYKMRIHNPLSSTQEALSAAAYSTSDRPFYAESMQHEDRVINGIFSPDGTKILTVSSDHTAKLWDSKGILLVDLNKHTDDVNSVDFSPNGTKIITASDDHTAKLWDLSGKLLADLKGHEGGVFNAVFSPDSTKIITVSKDHTAKLWDIKGNLLADLNKHTDRLDSAAFSPGGSKILTLSWDNTAKLWDLHGNLLADLNGHDDYVTSAVFSPDGSKIITASWDNTAKLWDLNGRLFANLKHTDYVWDAVFSPDGTKIITASSDRTAKLWDLKGNLLADLQHRGTVWFSTFSPDGTKILTRPEGAMKLWNLGGNFLADLNQYEGEVGGAVFSPDGSKIITWSGNTVKLWGLNGSLLSELKHTSYVSSVAFSSDGKTILTCSGNSAKLWNLEDNFLTDLKQHKHGFANAVISPDGSKIIDWSGNTARLWDLKGNLLTNLNKHKALILDTAFSPDGSKILTASWDSTAKLWDLNGNLLADLKHEAQVNQAVFSPDGSKIVTVSQDGAVKLWELNGKFFANLNMSMDVVNYAILSPEGDKVLTWWGNSARLWDLKEKPLADFNEHTNDINSAVFSPDGKKIVTTSKDGTAKLWDLRGKLLADLKGHRDSVSGAVFSGDGGRILTASEDGTAKLWDLEGNLLADLNRHRDDVLDAAFSSDGSRMITVSKDGTVKSWYTPEAIIQWLKSAPIPKLTKKDKEELGIADFEID
jgi:WD40 repeat protein/energy-coupling factor transporter ATP-binding protein EcfA2